MANRNGRCFTVAAQFGKKIRWSNNLDWALSEGYDDANANTLNWAVILVHRATGVGRRGCFLKFYQLKEFSSISVF
jgi:protein tyrosine phosphatase